MSEGPVLPFQRGYCSRENNSREYRRRIGKIPAVYATFAFRVEKQTSSQSLRAPVLQSLPERDRYESRGLDRILEAGVLKAAHLYLGVFAQLAVQREEIHI